MAVEDGNSSESLERFYQSLSAAQRESVQSVSMNMSQAFLQAIPEARKKVVFDHFHIVQSLKDTLNTTRKGGLLLVDRQLRQTAHRSRFHWFKNRHSLSNTALVWYFKEKVRDIWKGNRVRGT